MKYPHSLDDTKHVAVETTRLTPIRLDDGSRNGIGDRRMIDQHRYVTQHDAPDAIPPNSTSSRASFSSDDDDDASSISASNSHCSPNIHRFVGSRRRFIHEGQVVYSAVDDNVDFCPSPPRAIVETEKTKSRLRFCQTKSCGYFIRIALLDVPLIVLFSLWVFTLAIHYIHNVYLSKQIQLMGGFISDNRYQTDATYYRRVCTGEDVSATSLADLSVSSSVPPSHHRRNVQDAVEKMLTHGAIVFPEPLISDETVTSVRNYIVSVNKGHPLEVDTLEKNNRYAFPLDISMDPSLSKVWKELASHRTFIDVLEGIVGKDPTVVEFTSITSSYGAKSQKNHADVSDMASAANYARTYWSSYTLFIPLQDTTEKMGPTSICPGTHLCTRTAFKACARGGYDLPLSGGGGGQNAYLTNNTTVLDDDFDRGTQNSNNVWKQGTGLLWNRQVTHKGMGHEQEGGPDRVMLVISFAPRPQTHRFLDTRMAPLRSFYCLFWRMHGHTLSDYASSDVRTREPQRTLRAIGLLKGRGSNWLTYVMSQLAANEDGDYPDSELEDFHEAGGAYKYFPKTLQRPYFQELLNRTYYKEPDADNWHRFLLGTLINIETTLMRLNIVAFLSYLAIMATINFIRRTIQRIIPNKSTIGTERPPPPPPSRIIIRIIVMYGVILIIANFLIHDLRRTNWAKDIKSGRSYRIPVYIDGPDGGANDVEEDGEQKNYNTGHNQGPPLGRTMPGRDDVLITLDYSSRYYGSYSRILDYAHPGNVGWRKLKAFYGDGYSALSPPLQDEFCTFLMDRVQSKEYRHRFLKQDLTRFWVRLKDRKELVQFCHREMSMASDPLMDSLLREVDSLRTETRYGRFHWTAMQDNHIPAMLNEWENRLKARSSLRTDSGSSWLPTMTQKGAGYGTNQRRNPNSGCSTLMIRPSPSLLRRVTGSNISRKQQQQPNKQYLHHASSQSSPYSLFTKSSSLSLIVPFQDDHFDYPTTNNHMQQQQQYQQQKQQLEQQQYIEYEPYPGAWLESGDIVQVSTVCLDRKQRMREKDDIEDDTIMLDPDYYTIQVYNDSNRLLRDKIHTEWSYDDDDDHHHHHHHHHHPTLKDWTLWNVNSVSRSYTVRYHVVDHDAGPASEGVVLFGDDGVIVDPDCVRRRPQ